jgi:hypothetical protein
MYTEAAEQEALGRNRMLKRMLRVVVASWWMLYDIGLIEQLLQLCLLPPADRFILGETMLADELDARVRHEESHVHWQCPCLGSTPQQLGRQV